MRPPSYRGPRLAVRAVIVAAGRLLLVNAYPGQESDLWCAPGGGVERGQSLGDNLVREVREETGLAIHVGRLLGIEEFADPASGFHQVEILLRARLVDRPDAAVLADPEGVVNRLRWVGREEIGSLRVKPDSLASLAFGTQRPAAIGPLAAMAG